MTTLVGAQTTLTGLLAALIELELDTVAAYRTAMERVDSRIHQDLLLQCLLDHERHVNDLNLLLLQSQGDPPAGPDLKEMVTTGKVLLADALGDDFDILRATNSNEEDTYVAYERGVQRTDLPPTVSRTLELNWQDERRHRAWLAERLAALEHLQRVEEERELAEPTADSEPA